MKKAWPAEKSQTHNNHRKKRGVKWWSGLKVTRTLKNDKAFIRNQRQRLKQPDNRQQLETFLTSRGNKTEKYPPWTALLWGKFTSVTPITLKRVPSMYPPGTINFDSFYWPSGEPPVAVKVGQSDGSLWKRTFPSPLCGFIVSIYRGIHFLNDVPFRVK